MNIRCTMIGYMTKDIQAKTFPLLQEWTSAPCDLIDNTEDDIPLTSLWNDILHKSDADLHFLINADVWVTPRWLDRIREHLPSAFSAVSPASNFGVNHVDPGTNVTCPPSMAELMIVGAQVSERYNHMAALQKRISGFCFGVSKSTWQELHGFDEALPFYGNEDDFIVRAEKIGRYSYKIHSSYVWHWGNRSVLAKQEAQKRLPASSSSSSSSSSLAPPQNLLHL
ncbi:MAG: hypothetical protein UY48_C0003G0090 [Candidatus Gottesmanbacteria bacterium GW2011_GWB1_49_7]|uniref:Uncharacterized protein n=1 Tax=Candidatus Gottesmanbacteria bacterium GW2011_GWB1_49_7 TaxID=1618448 RepID=A0A0G1W3J0_9BACT|nr:MAG: hypothetical protein UY48_C0003G0090 [Candidatus Gottesmanbacteria bacterium GW2011_GWB1_49_7]